MKKTILATLSLAFFAFPAYASFLSRIFANRATMKATRLVALCACVFTLAASMSANATVIFVGNTAGIFTVETSTGATTPLASSINVADALTFGPNGLLFAGNTAGIFTVDVSTGATNRLGSQINVADALAFAPTVPEPTPVPEPPTLALFTVGLAGFGFVGWRRRKGPNQSLAQKPLGLLTAQ